MTSKHYHLNLGGRWLTEHMIEHMQPQGHRVWPPLDLTRLPILAQDKTTKMMAELRQHSIASPSMD